MEMTIDHQHHLVSIWLPNDEKDVAILEPVFRRYKGTPLSGGGIPLRQRGFGQQHRGVAAGKQGVILIRTTRT